MPNLVNFEELKRKVLPYFIAIYGEENREFIINKLEAIVPIFYTTIEGQMNAMYYEQNIKKTELTLRFLKENGIILPEEVIKKILQNNSTSYLNKYKEAYDFLYACFDGNAYSRNFGIRDIGLTPTDSAFKISQSVQKLAKFGIIAPENDYNNWLLSPEGQKAIMKVKNILISLAKLDSEYDIFNEKFIILQNRIEEARKIKDKLDYDYTLAYLDDIKDFLSPKEKEMLEKFKNSPNKNLYNLTSSFAILKIAGNLSFAYAPLYAFTKEAEAKLHNPEVSDFQKDSIKNNRLAYYKLQGLYNGEENVDTFLEVMKAEHKEPSLDDVEKILTTKEKYANKCNERYTMLTSTFSQNIAAIGSMNLVSDPDFAITDIIEKSICIAPAVTIQNNSPVLVPFLFFSKDMTIPGYSDIQFIHELNHALETSLVHYSPGKIIFKSGFEIIENGHDEKRNFTNFSEVINQLIAILVTKKMHDDNIYLFDNPTTARITGGTSYEKCQIFVNSFFDKLQSFIINARTSPSMDEFLTLVGADNFSRLNDIINEYSEMFNYNGASDVYDGKITSYTIKRQSLIEEADNITNQMLEHLKSIIGENR